MNELELIPPLKPKAIRKTRKSRKSQGASTRTTTTTTTTDRASARSTRTRTTTFTGRDIKPVAKPEWYWLFTAEEWQSINPIDREEIKKVIVGFTPWGDAYDLTKLFKGYDWWKESVTTRLNLLLFALDRNDLFRVERYYQKDTHEEVYLLYDYRNSPKIDVFPCDTMIRKTVAREDLLPPF